MKLDILAIGAHPDDIEFSCIGTMLKFKNELNKKIGFLILTKGEAGSRGTPQDRIKEQKAAAKIAGVHWIKLLDFPDSKVQNTEEARKEILSIVSELSPKLILRPYPPSHHPDHTQTGLICEETLGDFPSVQYCLTRFEFPFTHLVDISKQFETRMQSLLAHKTQVIPEYKKMVIKEAKEYGKILGVKYAEPFILDKKEDFGVFNFNRK